MITDVQLDSLVRAIEGGWVKIEQVPEELQKEVSKRMNNILRNDVIKSEDQS